MCRPLLFLLATQIPIAVAVPPVPDGMLRSLQDWLPTVHFGAPEFILSMPEGDKVPFGEGKCTGLSVGDVSLVDRSSGPRLDLRIIASGIDLQCVLQNKSLQVRMEAALRNSSLDVGVALQPVIMSGKAIPAFLNLNCTVGVRMGDLQFFGADETAGRLNGNKSRAVDQITSRLQSLLCYDIPNQANMFVNNMLGLAGIFAVEQQPETPQSKSPIMDWKTYPPVQLGKDMLAQRLVKWYTAFQADQHPLQVPLELPFHFTPNFAIRLGTLQVAGLETMAMPLLKDDHGIIEAALSAGHLQASLGLGFQVGGIEGSYQGLFEKLMAGVNLRDLEIGLSAVAMMSEPMFDALSVPQLQMPGCLLDAARGADNSSKGSLPNTLGLRQLLLNTTEVDVSMNTTGRLEQQLQGVVLHVLEHILDGYLPFLLSTARSLAFLKFQNLNSEFWQGTSDFQCSDDDGVEGVASAPVVTTMWVLSMLVAAGGMVAAGIVAFKQVRARQGMQPGPSSEGSDDPEVASRDTQEAAGASGRLTECLAKSGVPLPLSFLFPFAVVSVAFLFLFADLEIGTSVDVQITAGGRTTTIGPLFSFSLLSTIESTWEAGAFAISLLTLLFSGLWPFAKLALLLVAWLAPVRWVSVASRGRLLGFLDLCGKYSFLDSWFLVLCMSAFFLQWRGNSTSLKVTTDPTTAYFAFLLATILSLLLGNVASYYHRAAQAKEASTAAATTQRSALGLEVRGKVGYLIVSAVLFLAMVLTVVGTLIPTFAFEMSGLGSTMLFDEARHVVDYSVMGVGILASSGAPGTHLVLLLQVFFLLSSVLLPICLFGTLLLLWALPLTAQQQTTLYHVCELLDSWSTLDVVVITLIVGHFEFTELAERLVSTGNLQVGCGLAKASLGQSCMEVDLSILPAFCPLAIAGLAAMVLPKVMSWLCRLSMEARDTRLATQEKSGDAAQVQAKPPPVVGGRENQTPHSNESSYHM